MRYRAEGKKTLQRKSHLQTKSDELERRKAFLEGRREHLLSKMREMEEKEAVRNLFTTIYAPPAKRTCKDRSSFQDSGNLNLLFS